MKSPQSTYQLRLPRSVKAEVERRAFMHYNFVRIHQTLKITPAMAAGVTGKLWEMSDMVKVLENWEAVTKAA